MLPSDFTGILDWYDPADSTRLRKAADGTGAPPINLDDPVKYMANQQAARPVLSSAVGALYAPTGFNNLPGVKYNGAHVLQSAAAFAAAQEKSLTIAFNVISTGATGNPVLISSVNGNFYLMEFSGNGVHTIYFNGGSNNYGMTTLAPGVPETIIWTYDGAAVRGATARQRYRRNDLYGGLWTENTPFALNLGITGTGLSVGSYGPGGLPSTAMFGDIVTLDHAVVQSERGDLVGMLGERGKFNSRSFIFFTGDSIFDGTAIAAGEDTRAPAANVCEMAFTDIINAGYDVGRMRDSYPGRTMANWTTDYPLWLQPFTYRYSNPCRQIAFVNFAHNDLRNIGSDATITAARALTAKMAEFRIIPCFIMPLPSTVVGFEAIRQDYITKFLAAQNSSTPISTGGVVRWDLEPTMGPAAAAANATLYQDGIHPTAAGNAFLKVLIYNKAVQLLKPYSMMIGQRMSLVA